MRVGLAVKPVKARIAAPAAPAGTAGAAPAGTEDLAADITFVVIIAHSGGERAIGSAGFASNARVHVLGLRGVSRYLAAELGIGRTANTIAAGVFGLFFLHTLVEVKSNDRSRRGERHEGEYCNYLAHNCVENRGVRYKSQIGREQQSGRGAAADTDLVKSQRGVRPTTRSKLQFHCV